MLSNKPDHPAMDAILQAIESIDAAEALLKESKESLQKTLENLPALIGNDTALRNNFVWFLYWKVERVHKAWIRTAFQLTGKQFNAIISDAYITVTCIKCKQSRQVQVTSKAALGYSRTRHPMCDECHEKRKASDNQKYEQWNAERSAHLQELRAMPYREYLETPEWQERRKRAMKRAGFRCQVCNAHGVRLNVHHRTYERRGNEDDRDLIVLCQDCHAIFHENGSLASEEEG